MRRNLVVFSMLLVMMMVISSAPSAAQGAWVVQGKGTVKADATGFGTNGTILLFSTAKYPEKVRVKVTASVSPLDISINWFISCSNEAGTVTKSRNKNVNIQLEPGKSKFIPVPRPKMGPKAICNWSVDAFGSAFNGAMKMDVLVQATK